MADADSIDSPRDAKSKGGIPWIPLILTLLIVPVLTLVLMEFVVIPRLQSSLAGGEPTVHAAAGNHADEVAGHGGAVEASGPEESYKFDEVIANLSGAMGTRFIKVSFEVAGQDAQLRDLIRMKKPRVQDSIISTLSSRTIQDIEAPGGRNALRVALIGGINQAVGLNVVEELYFTEFIIQ